MNVVYVTGNAHKAKYFAKMVGLDIAHVKLDVDEIQSTDLREIVEHKARQAFALMNKPVIIEDTKLGFSALGNLPGPFIKWFQEQLGEEGLCRMLDSYDDRTAVAGAAIAYFDGDGMKIFEKELTGEIVENPVGNSGFGWNTIFKPDGAKNTLSQMSESEFRGYYKKIKPFEELKRFLKNKS